MGTKFQVLKWKALVGLEGTNLPTYLFLLICVIVRVLFLSNDVHFGCILFSKWVVQSFWV
jgi:hypothetical protein